MFDPSMSATLSRPLHLVFVLCAVACGCDPGDSVARVGGTVAAARNPASDTCASPQFADGVGPGTLVQCEGQLADSAFYYDQCKLGCGHPVKKPVEQIAFPEDQEVGACCIASATAELQAATCKSDCAHGACLGAIARFEELIADPATTAPCGVLAGCKARVFESLAYYRDFVVANFAACVQAVVDDQLFVLGEPPCGPFAGCLKTGSLELHCEITAVRHDVVLDGACVEALNQPPAPALDIEL